MIYSKKLQQYIPVQVEKSMYKIHDYGVFTKYSVKDNYIPVGYVDLKDTADGVWVEYIKNSNPDLYSGFGTIADQIEVEHCLNRGMDTFNITSYAGLNSHALHYKRGKRFSTVTNFKQRMKLLAQFHTTNVNTIVKNIIATTQNGQKYATQFLDKIPMYMPKEMIQKYMEIIKHSPLLK